MMQLRAHLASALGWLAMLAAGSVMASCDLYDAKPYPDAGTVEAGMDVSSPDAGSQDPRAPDFEDASMDAIVQASPSKRPSDGSLEPDRSLESDGSRDPTMGLPDAAGPVDAGAGDAAPPIRLGREGGCEGTPFHTFEFDQDEEGWLVENRDGPSAHDVSYASDEGSPRAGALRYHIEFTAEHQGAKARVILADPPAVRCISARLRVQPNSLDSDLARNPGKWTIATVSRPGGCFAQVPFGGVGALRQAGVWYELSAGTSDLEPGGCAFSKVEQIAIGISNADRTSSFTPADVFIDHVALY